MSFQNLVGTTILSFEGMKNGSDEIKIHTDKGMLRMKHYQDCCESVCVEDICGYPEDLVNQKVEVAEVRTNSSSNNGGVILWTFYTLRTTNGDVDIRWCGSSNGYYSVSVCCDWEEKVEDEIVEIPSEDSPIFQILTPTEEKPWGSGKRKTTLIRVRGLNFQISEIKGSTFLGSVNETVIFLIKEDGTRSNGQFESADDTNAALLLMMGMSDREFQDRLVECQKS